MKWLAWALASLLAAVSVYAQESALTSPTAAALYKVAPGPLEVDARNLDWRDEARGRDVPVRVYSPKTGDGPFPVIVFSHGLGGTREGYRHLGTHWASHGYVCVHLQHAGSDDSVWRGKTNRMQAMRDATKNVDNALNRYGDVRFAIDQIFQAREEAWLKGKLDLHNIGMAGHSFGAHTTQVVVGQGAGLAAGRLLQAHDTRISAAIIMSPNPPNRGDSARLFASIRIPCLHMTGTKDSSIVTDTTPEQRRIPFDHIPGPDNYLVTFRDGNHMVFSDRIALIADPRDEKLRAYILASTTAFWDAFLKKDEAAKKWLVEADGFEKALGADGVFERKPEKPATGGAEPKSGD